MINIIKILLLEDDERDKFQIRNAIKHCYSTLSDSLNGKKIEINSFDFSKYSSTDSVKQNILFEIDDCEYSSVIIDQKIILQDGYVDGNEVFEFIKNSVPFFPVVMLTQLPDQCEQKGMVDYDKIYGKKEFLKTDSDLVKKLICNAEQYLNNLKTIFAELKQFNKEDADDFRRYMELETKLNNYLPKFYTKRFTQSFSEEYKKILLIIEKIEKYIDEK